MLMHPTTASLFTTSVTMALLVVMLFSILSTRPVPAADDRGAGRLPQPRQPRPSKPGSRRGSPRLPGMSSEPGARQSADLKALRAQVAVLTQALEEQSALLAAAEQAQATERQADLDRLLTVVGALRGSSVPADGRTLDRVEAALRRALDPNAGPAWAAPGALPGAVVLTGLPVQRAADADASARQRA